MRFDRWNKSARLTLSEIVEQQRDVVDEDLFPVNATAAVVVWA